MPFNPYKDKKIVSTHSRLKAAGAGRKIFIHGIPVSTHSRLKAAGRPVAESTP